MNGPARQDIVWLGVSAAVIGCLVGGLMLGVGLVLAVGHAAAAYLLILPAAPVSGGVGWLLSRRLAAQLDNR